MNTSVFVKRKEKLTQITLTPTRDTGGPRDAAHTEVQMPTYTTTFPVFF